MGDGQIRVILQMMNDISDVLRHLERRMKNNDLLQRDLDIAKKGVEEIREMVEKLDVLEQEAEQELNSNGQSFRYHDIRTDIDKLRRLIQRLTKALVEVVTDLRNS
jgi:hypothetical protein